MRHETALILLSVRSPIQTGRLQNVLRYLKKSLIPGLIDTAAASAAKDGESLLRLETSVKAYAPSAIQGTQLPIGAG